MKMHPHEVRVEDHRILGEAYLVGMVLNLSLDGESYIYVHHLHELGTCTCIHVDTLLERKRHDIEMLQRVVNNFKRRLECC